MGWVKDDRFKVVRELMNEVGHEKAPAELCRRGICVSRAEARRLVRCIKIQRKEHNGN